MESRTAESRSGHRPAGRSVSAAGLPARILLGVLATGGLVLAVRMVSSPAPVATLQLTPERPVILGIAPLRLTDPGIDPVKVEPGRIDPRTGLREDVLTRGRFESLDAPLLRLALTRGAGAEQVPSLFVLLARRAGHPAGGGQPLSVAKSGPRGSVATRFGAVETLQATLVGSVSRACTGFVARQAALRIDGFLCAPLGGAPAPQTLACTLDALELDDPGDPAASAAFRGARAPSDCQRAGNAGTEAPNRTGSIVQRRADTNN